MKKNNKKIDMLNGTLWNKILMFALPVAASSFLQQFFNSVDIAVVGRYSTDEALAAVSSNSSVISLLINLFVGVTLGANVVIANYIGKQERRKISTAVHTALLTSFICGVFLLIMGFFIAEPILMLMNTPSDALPLAVQYLRIYFMGMPFFMIYNAGASILRSVGDTKRPLVCLIVSGVFNAALNLVLVIKFDLGVVGVGSATAISNLISAGMIVYILTHEEGEIKLHFTKLKIDGRELGRILIIGIPAGLQGVVFSISNVCLQSAINGFGKMEIAGSGAAVNFEYFTYFMISAFNQATVTFMSQNYGAGKVDRCKKIYKLNMMFAVLTAICMSILFLVFKSFFVGLFTQNEAVKEVAYRRMGICILCQTLVCGYEITASAMRGLGYSITPTIVVVLGSCVLRLIWVYFIFPFNKSFEFLLYIYPISWCLTTIVTITAYRFVNRRAFLKLELQM